MGYRKQPFGYKMELGEIVIHRKEAEIVQYIFRQYIGGGTYKGIVAYLREQPVAYDVDKLWNKNMIARILGDRRYQGATDYPAIVTESEMDAVAAKQASKQCPIQKSESQKVLRQLSGCTATTRMEQQVLDILNGLVGRPEKILEQSPPKASAEVDSLQKRLDTILEQQPIDENAARELIFAIAVAQYDAIGSEEYETQRLRRVFASTAPMIELNANLLRSTVAAIQVNGNGEISVRLKNGQIVERRKTP